MQMPSHPFCFSAIPARKPTDQQPTGLYPIQALVARAYPALFGDWNCEVVALELLRTFWEKATILHSEYHRPVDSPTPDRYAAHVYVRTTAF
jgi:hypothetical protein